MADEPDNTKASLRQLWQLPVLLLSLVLFGVGLYLSRPTVDLDAQRTAVLEGIKAQIAAGQYEAALESSKASSEQAAEWPRPAQAEFHQHVGDALYLGQRSKGWSHPVNHQRVIDAYARSRELGGALDAQRSQRRAESMVELGQVDAALKLLGELGEAGGEARQRMLRGLITAAMRKTDAPERAPRLLEQLLKEPRLALEHEVWAVARQAELSLRHGDTRAVIETLLRRLARLQDQKDAPLGELMVQLGKAYHAEGDAANAERWMFDARKRLQESDPLNGEALVVLGKIRFAEENVLEALEHFSMVVERYPATPVFAVALVGKAECEARRGALAVALGDYEQAVKLLTMDRGSADAALVAELTDSLETQHELRFGQGDYDNALSILRIQRGLYTPPLPRELLLKLATAHELIARKRLGLSEGQTETPAHWQKLAKDERPRTAEHYESAAGYYYQHAESVQKDDEPAYSQGLWRSADLYDRAGLHRKAIEVFEQFVKGREQDPRKVTALYRLAQAHQADGNLPRSIELYKQVIEQHANTPEAYGSLVPLARALLSRGEKSADEAEHVLLTVVTDHPALRPESSEYREALVELGQLYYRRAAEGDYEKAITRLTEVVQRYGGERRLPDLEFKLGDAYRKSVQQIDKKLAGAQQPSKRAAMQAERVKRLDEAHKHFEAVVLAYEKRDAKSLSDLESLYLRNSYFYRGDCAYDLGQYDGPEGAIALYEAAVQRYESDPASLVGLVQIVNSYAELGKWDQARKANERAKVYLQRIPEEAFNDPNLPMSRQHWQRWLDWTSQLALTEGSATTTTKATTP